MEIEAIKKRLPHRYPFLLVDRILEQEEGRVVGLKNVTVNEPFFTGHFPDPHESVMPGVLIFEAMAQTAAFLIQPTADAGPAMGYLVGLDKAKVRRKVVPGDQLRLEATLLRRKRNLVQAEVRATVDEEIAASAVLAFVISEG